MRRKRKNEQGYALVLIMFFLALLVLSTVVAAPTVLSTMQRDKEAELVWRGKQYTRGIRMYYMKMHRFPISMDDITQPKNNIRFMRKAYKDPMNTLDGSWRLIYVGPNGQLIGSLNSQFLGMYGPTGAPNGLAGAGRSSPFGGSSSSFGNNTGIGGAGTGAAATNSNQAQTDGTGDASSTDPNAQNPDNPDQTGQPHAIGTMDASNTIGGNIIGVGSKINKKSFLWYQKAKNYRQFEFIWDPSKDTTLMGGASRGIGMPIPVQGPPNTGAPGTVAPSQPDPSQNQNPGVNSTRNDNLPSQAPRSQ